MGLIDTRIKVSRFDKNCSPIESREQKSKSWLKHFFDILYVASGQGNSLAAVNDYLGAARTIANSTNWMDTNLSIGSPPGGVTVNLLCPNGNPEGPETITVPSGELIGIVVGTNNAAVSPTNDALGARVLHGIGAGLLAYGGCEVLRLSFVDPNGQFTVQRFFTNLSGGDIVIAEVGLYSPAWISATQSRIFCVCRDVVAPAVTVHDTEILLAQYTVQVTV